MSKRSPCPWPLGTSKQEIRHEDHRRSLGSGPLARFRILGPGRLQCRLRRRQRLPANVLNSFQAGPETIANVRQSGYQDAYAHVSQETLTSVINATQKSTAGSTLGQATVDASVKGTTKWLADAAKDATFLNAQSADSITGAKGDLTTIAALRAGGNTTLDSTQIQAEQGLLVSTQESLFGGTNYAGVRSNTAQSTILLGQKGDGLNNAGVLQTNQSQSVLGTEQIDTMQSYPSGDLNTVTALPKDIK